MTIYDALFGGILIGISALVLYGFTGRIAGISGISFGFLWGEHSERKWRFAFLVGLALGGSLAMAVGVSLPKAQMPGNVSGIIQLVLAGLLVGVGTQMGNGCTSGHGVCGIARLSPRSIVSVITFMAVGMFTASLLNPLLN